MAIIHLNEDNFEEKTKDLTVIDFWAPWCGPCRMMAPVFEELASEFKGKMQFAKVDVDEEPVLASRFGISGIPCLIIVEDGEEKGRIVGFNPKEVLKEKLEEFL